MRNKTKVNRNWSVFGSTISAKLYLLVLTFSEETFTFKTPMVVSLGLCRLYSLLYSSYSDWEKPNNSKTRQQVTQALCLVDLCLFFDKVLKWDNWPGTSKRDCIKCFLFYILFVFHSQDFTISVTSPPDQGVTRNKYNK